MTEKLDTIFNQTARDYPDNTAILYYQNESTPEEITYRQLQDESNNITEMISQLPASLCEDLALTSENTHDNVGSEMDDSITASSHKNRSCKSVIAILGHPGPSVISCILGVLQRNAYFYISPDCTNIELMTCISRVKPKYFLVEESIFDYYNFDISMVVSNCLVFGKTFRLISYKDSQVQVPKSVLLDLAYVITTSGSTGTPKFVYVPHKCIVPNITDFVDIFKIKAADSIFCAAPLTFDPSVIDLFMAFKTGAKLVMVPPSILKMPDALLDIMIRSKITILQATPTLMMSLKMKLKETILSETFGLRVLALGGEPFPKLSILRMWLDTKCQTKVFNIYGITEVSCWATVEEVVVGEHSHKDKTMQNNAVSVIDDIIPIGKPLSCTVVRVLNNNNEEVAYGEEGEVFVGGKERVCWVDDGILPTCDNVSGSNLKSTGGVCVTSNCIENEESRLIFRGTGDRGVLINGNIYCLGRVDFIVKRHGQKVSLLEITRACESLSYVEKCIVIEETKKITAFVSIVNRNLITSKALRDDLKSLLSYWKMPDDIIILETIPFNKHGKVNKEALLQDKYLRISKLESIDSLEKLLGMLWKRKLGVSEVHYRDNFIMSGGNSLMAVQLVEEINKHFADEVPELLDVILNKKFDSIMKLLTHYHVKDEDQGTQHPKKVKKLQMEQLDERTNLSVMKPNALQYNNKKTPANTKVRMSVVSRRGYYNRGVEVCDKLITPYSAELAWKYNLGKCIDSSPIIVEYNSKTLFFVGSHSHRFICIDAVTGAKQWCNMLADRIESSPNLSPDGKYIYVGCYSGDLYCIEIDSGLIIWRYRTGDVVKSSPVIDYKTGYVIVGSHDKNLYCLDDEGRLVWKNEIGKGSIFSSPCIDDHLVFAATLDGIIAGIDIKTGKTQWKDSINKPIFSSPAVYSRGIVFGSVAGEIFSYSFSGSKLWSYVTGDSIFSSPFVLKLQNEDEIIAIGCHNKKVYFLSGSGVEVSVYNGSSPIYSTPFLYKTSDAGFISVISGTSGLVCLIKLFTGDLITKENLCSMPSTILTELNLPGEVFSSPIVYKNKLYVCCRDNFIYCFDLKCNQS